MAGAIHPRSWRAGSFAILWLIAAAISSTAVTPENLPEQGVTARGAGQLPALGIERLPSGETYVKVRGSGDSVALSSAAGFAIDHRSRLLLQVAVPSVHGPGQIRLTPGRAPPAPLPSSI